MPELLCCHEDCPVHREVEVPIEHIQYPLVWYCMEHRGMTMFLPKSEARPQSPPQPKKRRYFA